MKAWSVAIMFSANGCTGLSSIFTLAQTRGEAVAAGVRNVFDMIAPDGHPTVCINIIGTLAAQVDPDAVSAAAEALKDAAHS